MSAGTLSAGVRRPSVLDSLARDKYIVSPAFDWTFFIGSPLLAVGLVHFATRFISEATLGGLILSFMAVGHHVPTFLRAYADPDEFARNRYRLTVVPILVVLLVALLAVLNSHLLALVFIWDQYHFVRQHYGFMRIYDAKNGSTTKAGGPNLDLWLCFSLFVYIVAEGDFYSYVYSSELFAAGVAPPLWLGPLLLNVSFAIAAAVLLLFALDVARRVREGEPVSMLKIAVTLTTYGVWYYAYVVFSNPFLSYGISSLFHCMQYDALAWHYNRRKASSLVAGRGRFFQFVHAGHHLWAYVGAIFAYGSFAWFLGPLAPLPVFIVNRTTGVLHYYYDSFIWQVRRAEFRKLLE
ncbi:MAG TPA: hypothetical protein VMH82_13230 [Myxococcota bacterium]|nr:hypothetical protein [Myxococcota bacterium]